MIRLHGKKDTVRKLVVKYLDTSRTLSQQQDQFLVEKVIRKVIFCQYLGAYMRHLPLCLTQAQLECDELMKYEGGWAVRDMMAQFLRNHTANERKLSERLRVNVLTLQRKRLRPAYLEREYEQANDIILQYK